MNILVINICLRPESSVKLFPVGLGYITTAMKNAGFDFDLLDINAYRYTDGQIEQFIRGKKYDVICMGTVVTGYRIVKSLAALIKKCHPYSKIIVGNTVATSVFDTLLRRTKVDIAVIGEGEETIVDILRKLSESKPLEEVRGICFMKDGNVVCTPPRPLIKDISSLPFMNYSLFDLEIYIDGTKQRINDPLPIPREEIRALQVSIARGCIAKCTFCYHIFQDMPYRRRTSESIVTEIKSIIEKYSINFVIFWDDLALSSKKHTLEFVEKILNEKAKFYWMANCRPNLFDDEADMPMIEKMKEAGCLGLCYGLESADSNILREMKRRIPVNQFSKQTRLLQKAGLQTWTTVVFGYPQETPETIKKTFDACIENNIYPSTGYLLPLPGSQMYDYAVSHGFIEDEESYLLRLGDRQDLRVNMTQMSDEEFAAHVVNGLQRCNEKLNLGLEKDKLIKTQYYRGASQSKSF